MSNFAVLLLKEERALFSSPIAYAAITVFLLSLVVRARAGKVVTGSEGMIGQLGVAIGALPPGGGHATNGFSIEGRDEAAHRILSAGHSDDPRSPLLIR